MVFVQWIRVVDLSRTDKESMSGHCFIFCKQSVLAVITVSDGDTYLSSGSIDTNQFRVLYTTYNRKISNDPSTFFILDLLILLKNDSWPLVF
ncbi:hypothetical protein HanRHA438_Chr11g0496151 [Helianthus annuus]|nr:hypothetical protein HanRHA438_Chr11g0496151 [Helianthus annuus]